MAKIICTQAEYDKLSTVLEDNPQFLADVKVVYDIVEDVSSIPKDYGTDKNKIKRHANKPKEFSEYIGKPLRDLVNAIYPRKTGDTYIYGVSGCPHHYTLFSRDYCLCDASGGNCSDCWDQLYTGYHKED
jgi:hypothetical protein